MPAVWSQQPSRQTLMLKIRSPMPDCRIGEASSQRLLAILYALGHFGDGVGALGDLVLQLDLRGEGPLLFAHQLENFLDRSLALAPRHVAAVGRPVLEMQAHDPVV